jgi:hypothetical protein
MAVLGFELGLVLAKQVFFLLSHHTNPKLFIFKSTVFIFFSEFFFFFFFLFETGSCCVAQADLYLSRPASASHVLVLQPCAATPSLCFL